MIETAPRKKDPFSALRETQIIASKPVLPAGQSDVPRAVLIWSDQS